jgi:hypothetical protein
VFLELLFRDHIPVLVRGDSSMFIQLVKVTTCPSLLVVSLSPSLPLLNAPTLFLLFKAMTLGLDSLDTIMATHSASCMDHLGKACSPPPLLFSSQMCTISLPPPAQFHFDNKRKSTPTMMALRNILENNNRLWYIYIYTLMII